MTRWTSGSGSEAETLVASPGGTPLGAYSPVDLGTAILEATPWPVVVADSLTGTVVSVNSGAQELTGFAAEELVGRDVWDMLVAPTERDTVRGSYAVLGGTGIPQAFEVTLVTRSGATRRVLWSCAVLALEIRPDGDLVVMTGIELSAGAPPGGLFGQLISAAAHTASAVTDMDGRVTIWSAAAEQMLGYTRDDVVGRVLPRSIFDWDELEVRATQAGLEADLRLLTVHPSRLDRRRGAEVDLGELDRRRMRRAGERSSDQPERGAPPGNRWSLRHKDGSSITVALSVTPVTDAAGRQVGFLGLGTDVSAERRTHDLLVSALERDSAAVERLRELDQAKDVLVATVSHELRTPLTSIDGYTELLEDGIGGTLEPQQLAHVVAIRRNTDRLSALVEDLLDLSGLEQKDSSEQRVRIDVREVVQHAWSTMHPSGEERRLTFELELPHDAVIVDGDAESLERAVLNLLANAVKFTQDGGSVSCVLREEDGQAVLTVADTGCGIPVDEQGFLFDRFFRGALSREREIQGSGLGLAIVAAVVEGHRGEITVRSQPAAGAEFTMVLPLSEARVPLHTVVR